jgi:hypothetical protein
VGRGKRFGYVIVINLAMIKNMISDSDEERLARLECKGAIRRGTGDLAAWFKTHKPIEIPEGASVLQALLEERESGR